MERELRSKLIRLAHENPHLRSDILPLLGEPKTAAADKKVKGKALDKLISDTYYKHGNYVVINMMSIPKIYKEATDAYTAAATHAEGLKALDDAMKAAIAKYKTASQSKLAHGAVALRNPQVMLYVIDPVDNKSKFYEMAVVPQGDESPAMKTTDFSRGAGGWVLMKRWGRLTDKGGVTGRVDSMNEIYADQAAAITMMAIHKDKKIRSSGYKDVSRTKTYPIGLGSAGFGWGGQAACVYVPELKQLAALVNKSKADLMGMASTLNVLERRNSGMAKQISVLYLDAMGSLGKLDTYLEGQLSAC